MRKCSACFAMQHVVVPRRLMEEHPHSSCSPADTLSQQATHTLIMYWDAPVTITFDNYTTVDISYYTATA